MNSLSLYRKYRSQKFADLAGQEHVSITLQNAIRAGRVAHAYLFCGPRGTGKTSTARLLAKALNCEQGLAPEPCDACDSCREIRVGSSLDVLEIDAASHRGIDDVRAIRDQIAYHPARGRYRVYVIDEVHMLTGEAFNALLKTLEEPPPHAVFVLATTEAHKIPATILSRCQRFVFRRASHDQLVERLRQVAADEQIDVDPEALGLLARHADGSWRDSLSLLEQVVAFTGGSVNAESVRTVLGLADDETLAGIVDAVGSGDAGRLIDRVAETLDGGRDARQLLADLTGYFSDLLKSAAGGRFERPPESAARLRQQAGRFSVPQLTAAVELLAGAERDLRWSQQTRLLLETLLIRLALEAADGAAGPSKSPSARAQPAAPAAPSPAASPRAAAAAPRRDPEPPAADRRRRQTAPEGEPDAGPAPASGSAASSAPPTAAAGADPWDALEREQSAPPAAARGPESAEAADSEEAESNPGLHAVRRNWRMITEELKRRRKMVLYALLTDATPVDLRGDELVIEHLHPATAERLVERQTQDSETLPAVIRDLTGVECRIRVRARGSDIGTVSTEPVVIDRSQHASSSRRSGEEAGPAGGQRELIHEVMEIFKGRIVDGDPEQETGRR